MNITLAQHQNDDLSGETNINIKATIDGIEMFVPINSANRHYAEIMRQVKAGELTIADAD